ncbi:MAG: hypothetical protein RSH52_25180, partial [Janthinobacterium sp.]
MPCLQHEHIDFKLLALQFYCILHLFVCFFDIHGWAAKKNNTDVLGIKLADIASLMHINQCGRGASAARFMCWYRGITAHRRFLVQLKQLPLCDCCCLAGSNHACHAVI